MREYLCFLGRDLAYQRVDDELAYPLKCYGERGGAFLAGLGDSAEPLGSVGLKDLGPLDGIPTAEIKRLWVRPQARRHGLGVTLVRQALRLARDRGHHRVVLDTTADLASANRLYERLGFTPIAPYCHNPFPQARFFEFRLT
jgi:ribosomal protein S18 acetylase RimI-like enzyme